jgi:hypothetical protein
MRRWPDAAIATAVVILLATSFLPWYRTGWAGSEDGVGPFYATSSATAWQASTGWSTAVILGVVAGLAWLLLPPRPRLLRFVPTLLAAAGLGLATWTWLRIGPPRLVDGAAWTATSDTASGVGEIVRDELFRLHVEGLDYDVAWGLYAGLAALAGLTLLLAFRPLWKDVAARGGRS